METGQNEAKSTGLYKEISRRIDDWLEAHQGETFDLDVVCRHLEITSAEGRKQAIVKLFNETKKSRLEKGGKGNREYRYINTIVSEIDWVNAQENDKFDVIWPYGVSDNTHFGFDGHIIIPQRSIIMVAGVSNMGKTTMALNFLWMNMDKYPCTLMGNEYEPSQFKRRAQNMKFRNPLKLDGKPKFELIERHDNWKDIIRPDNVNIIDWINLGDKFYEMGKIIEGIKEKLNKGIAFICIQKDAGKTYGMGGMWGTHLSTLYLTLDFGRMTVEKAKEWNGHNPNREMYGFDIIEHGSQFANIHSVSFCRKCYGKTGNNKCELCFGKGVVPAEYNSCDIWLPEYQVALEEPF